MSSDDEFELLCGGSARVSTLVDVAQFTYSNTELAQANEIAAPILKWIKKKQKDHPKFGEKDIKFFQDQKTIRRYGTELLKRLERWYVKHCAYSHYKHDSGTKAHFIKLLTQDPVGVTVPDNSDTFCWRRSTVVTATGSSTPSTPTGPTTRSAGAAAASTTSGTATTVGAQFTKTQFLINLQHTQRTIYLMLRSTLPKRFAGKDASTRIQGFIDDTEKERVDKGDITEDNRFDVGDRVEWDKIKEFVL